MADALNNTIRRISPAGVVTTLAGQADGPNTDVNGTGTSAEFYRPYGIAIDGTGNLYVTDRDALIRKGSNQTGESSPGIATPPASSAITAGGDASFTVAATGVPAPTFQWEVSTNGGSTFTDLTNGGEISGSTSATLGITGAPASLNGAEYECVLTNSLGSVTTTPVTLTVSPALDATPYTFTTLAGTAGGIGSVDGTGSAARFSAPTGTAVDKSGNVYVADTDNNTIREITPAGIVTTIAGTPNMYGGASDGTGAAAKFQFQGSAGLAVDGSGNLFVADSGNMDIREIVPTAGAGGATNWVVTTIAGSAGKVGSTDGAGGAARFDLPSGIAVDGSDNLYVADTFNETIRKIVPNTSGGVTTWTVSTLAGAVFSSGSVDGTGGAARFSGPHGVAVDGSGNVYVADTSNATVREISPVGVVTTLAGTAGARGASDGTGGVAQFEYPDGVAATATGTVFVADSGNDTIRRITPAGVVSTVGGMAGLTGSSDGTGSVARLDDPAGIAVDTSGNLYVSDTGNDTVRKAIPPGAPSISVQPATQAVNVGSGVVLSVTASGSSPLTYQWLFNGSPLSGDTSSTLSIADVQTANAGNYSVEVSDSFGNTTTSATGTLTVNAVSAAGITTQPHSQSIATGSTVVFTVTAGGTVGSALARPGGQSAALTSGTTYQWMYNGANLTDGGAISGSSGPQLVITGASSANDGDYSCLVTTGGVAVQSDSAGLVVGTVSIPGYVVNISSRAFVGTGDSILIGGFFVGGSTSRSVLIQALGPALSSQGVSGVLQHPALTIHDSTGKVIYSNTGWGSNPVLLKAAAAAYANPVLTPDSPDSEALLTLPPGGYTAEISGADGGTGVALCAIYQLP